MTEYSDGTFEQFVKVPSTPFVLSRRWDRFGARILDIANGLFVARALDLPFRFQWVHDDRNPETDAQIRFFNSGFRAEYSLPADAVAGLASFDAPDYERLDLDTVRRALAAQRPSSYFRPRGLFEIPVIYGRADRDRAQEFRSIMLEMMAPEFRDRLRQVGDSLPTGKELTMVHARFGDMVDGGFRQYPEPSKYVPLYQIDRVLDLLCDDDRVVVLATDSPEAARQLGLRHPQLTTASDLGLEVPGGDELDGMFTDIALFARADRIVGPPLSAFSTLGAALGRRRVESVYQVLESQGAADELPDPAVYAGFDRRLGGAFESRDLCAFLDKKALSIEPQEYLSLAMRATASDPSFVLAWCHAAAATVLAGGSLSVALELLARARPYADSARAVHSDPLYIVAATEFFVRLYVPLHAGETRVRFARVGRLVRLAYLLGTLRTQQMEVDDIRVATRALVRRAEPTLPTGAPSTLARIMRQAWMAFIPAKFPAVPGRPFAARLHEHATALDYPNLISVLIVALAETCEDR